jgi:uncharacterized hydrophobic protein (TIGR00271 family)
MTETIRQWWTSSVVNDVDHRSVVAQVREDAGWSSHVAFMTLMSAGIAILGLLLSSPAIVIGAMLIAPFMGPIIGLGFALATFDSREMRRTALPIAVGVVLAVLFCALIVLVSPLQNVTTEITSRTRPNLFDLLVALFAGLAGTYAVIRGRHGTIVGVAIATALMPPLAVMGFGLAVVSWEILAGSTLLFFTNLMTMAVAAAVLARLYGFAPKLSPHQTRLQVALIVTIVGILALPLALTLKQIAREAFAIRQANAQILSEFPKGARIGNLEIDYHSSPVEVSATVFTPQYRAGAERALSDSLQGVMGTRTNISIDQIRTANGAEALSAAKALSAQRRASQLAERLAMVAGVPFENVVLDRSAKRASVRAAVLPGADLASYRALEARVAASDPAWTVVLVPPALPLPAVQDKDAKLDQDALSTSVWAAQRLGLGVTVSGGSGELADEVAETLEKAGIKVKVNAPDGEAGRVTLRWLLPIDGREAGETAN